MTIRSVVFDAYGTLYDIQSVATVTEQAFPGYGDIITQLWRIKQLEYTWLRSLMGRYKDFAAVTAESLAYALRVLGLSPDEHLGAILVRAAVGARLGGGLGAHRIRPRRRDRSLAAMYSNLQSAPMTTAVAPLRGRMARGGVLVLGGGAARPTADHATR